MNPASRKRQILTLVLNGVLWIAVTVITIFGVLYGAGSGQNGDHMIGIGYFKAYTMDSNVLAGLSALIILICTGKKLCGKGDALPKWAMLFHLMTSVGLLLTFLISAAFLAPMKVAEGQSYLLMFEGDLLFFHFLNPLLSVLSFTCFIKEHTLSRKDSLWGMLHTVIYSVVYLLMVAVFKLWTDFYNFTFGGKFALIPVVLVVIYALTYGLSRLLCAWHNQGIQ